MSLSPGTRLGPYAVIAQLGEGGMGAVRSPLVASCLVVLVLLGSPTAAQVAPQSPGAAPGNASAGSMTSLQRIRRALALTPPAGFLNLHEYVHVIAEAPDVSLFGDFDFFSGPVPFGPPTHRRPCSRC